MHLSDWTTSLEKREQFHLWATLFTQNEETVASYSMSIHPNKTPALHARNCLNYVTNMNNYLWNHELRFSYKQQKFNILTNDQQR